jgi:hypothetical protein
MRAARQGSFDGLCGVYAVINALDPAGVSLRRSQLHADLFKELTYGLGAVSLLSAMHDGLGSDELLRTTRAAFRWLALEHGIHLTVDAPYVTRRFKAHGDFIEKLRRHMAADDEAVVTYLITPSRDHWTVPTSIVGRKLLLRDSGGLASLPLPRLMAASSGWSFSWPDTLVIRSVAREGTE